MSYLILQFQHINQLSTTYFMQGQPSSKQTSITSELIVPPPIVIQDQNKQYEDQLQDQQQRKDKQKIKNRFAKHREHCATFQPIEACSSELNYPTNLVGYIQRENDDQMLGTCLFVTADCIVTTMHSLYQILRSSSKIIVKLPLSNHVQNTRFNSFEVDKNRVWLNKKYQQKRSIEDDYGFIRVKNLHHISYIQKKTRKLKFSNGYKLSDTRFTFDNGQIFGFLKEIPQQAPISDDINKRLRLRAVVTSEGLFEYNGKFFKHNCYTIDGMSGAPIFVKQPESDEYCLVGMHACSNYVIKQNYALLFRQNFYKELSKFIAEPIKFQERTQNVIEKQVTLKDKLDQIRNKGNIIEKLKALGIIVYHLLKQLDQYEQRQIYFHQIKYEDVKVEANKLVIKNVDNLCINLFKRRKMLKNHGNFHYFSKFLQLNRSILEQFKQSLDVTKGHHLLLLIDQIVFHHKDKIVTLSFLKQKIDKYYKVDQIIQIRPSSEDNSKIQQTTKQFIPYRNQDFQRFRQFIQINDFYLEEFELRAIKFTNLFKLHNGQLTAKSILKIYLCILVKTHKKIKNTLQFIKTIVQNQRKTQYEGHLHELNNINNEININFGLSYQENKQIQKYKYKERSLLKYKIGIVMKQYQQFYEQQFNKLNLDKKIINSLVEYQINFINIIYKKHYLPIIQKIASIKLKKFFQDYKIKIEENLHNFINKNRDNEVVIQDNNIPQNHNYLKFMRQKQRVDFKNLKINKIFQVNQTRQHVYRMKPITSLIQHQKYDQLKKKIVKIHCNSDFKGVGVVISPFLIFSVAHVFTDHKKNLKSPQQIKKTYRIYYNRNQYEIVESHKGDSDAIILRLGRSIYFNPNIPIMNFKRDLRIGDERYFSILITHGQQKKNAQIYQRCIGNTPINSKYYPNHYIPLTGHPKVSGAPIFVWLKNQTPFLLGVYRGFTQRDSFNKKYGRYTRFDSNQFKNIRSGQNLRIQQIESKDIEDLDHQKFSEYIIDHYDTVDHFLLRVLAQILRLNNYHFYLQKLQLANIITDIDNNLTILFNNVKIIRKQTLTIDQNLRKQLQEQFYNRKRAQKGAQFYQIEQLQFMSLNAFYQFMKQVKKKFPQNQIKDSVLFPLPIKQDILSVSDYAEMIDRKFEVVCEKLQAQKQQKTQIIKIILRKQENNYVKIPKKAHYFTIYEKHFVNKPKYRVQRLLTEWGIIRTDNKENQSERLRELNNDILSQRSRKVKDLKKKIQKTIQDYFNEDSQNQQYYNSTSNYEITFIKSIFKKGFQSIQQKIIEDSLISRQKSTHDQQIFKDHLNRQIRRATSNELEFNEKLAELSVDQLAEFKCKYRDIIQWKIIQDINQHIQCLHSLQRQDLKWFKMIVT